MGRANPTSFWSGEGVKNRPLFFGMLHLYIDEAAKTLMPNAVVAHPVHTVLFYVTEDFRRVLIDYDYKIITILFFLNPLKDVHDDEFE